MVANFFKKTWGDLMRLIIIFVVIFIVGIEVDDGSLMILRARSRLFRGGPRSELLFGDGVWPALILS